MGAAEDRAREAVKAVEGAAQEYPPNEVEGSVLTRWVLVAEWSSPNGGRWLSRLYPPDQTTWEIEGMLRHAMRERIGPEPDDSWGGDGDD